MQQYDAAVDKAIAQLQRDPVLAPVIQHVGRYRVKPHNNYYQELVESIIGQQLSIKAAATITQRFVALFGDTFPSPEQILTKQVEDLRAAGLSNAKAKYVLDLAKHVQEGTLQVDKLPSLSNEEVIRELTAVKGIGEWTAHMFLLFSLGRLDVLPVGDLGFRIGLQKLYGFAALPTPAQIKELSEHNHWHPYESVATWYVWQSLNS